jgi:hypothetical protein
VISHLLVCSVDYAQFKKFAALDEPTLSAIEKEFDPTVKAERDRLATLHAKQMSALREELSKRIPGAE